MGKRGALGRLAAPQPPRTRQQEADEDTDALQLPPDLQIGAPFSDDDDGDAVVVSSSEDDDAQAAGSDDEAIQAAMHEYAATAATDQRLRELARARATNGHGDGTNGDDASSDGGGDEEEKGRPLDPGSDSSEDERENRNTVGDVPLEWYKDEDHIGYDKDGQPIKKTARKDRLSQLLDRNDSKKALRTIYDEYNDEEITLTKEELRMIMAIRAGQFPHVEVNPYEPYNDWFTRDVQTVPIRDDPVPKRRFTPSKHEEKKIVKLVRAIRKGWLKTSDQKKAAEKPKAYLLWGDDGLAEGSTKTGVGLSYIPPAKPRLPGHAESYNPPPEYLPTEAELSSYELMDPEDRPKFVPQAFKSLRQVPMYGSFIRDVFERCLDLYLCPRVRKKKLHIDPQQLVPQLPKPADLQPFPTHLAMAYSGHNGKVRSCAVDATGQWLLSGGDDGTCRVWELRSGRCMRVWDLGAAVHCVAWCPGAQAKGLVSATCGQSVVLLPGACGSPADREASAQVLSSGLQAAEEAGLGGAAPGQGQSVAWAAHPSIPQAVAITHKFPVRHVAWHARGDYFASVAPTGITQSVLVHQLSKGASQAPFRKNRGRVPCVAFHPSKPFFFLAAQNHVYVYNLAKQALSKRLLGGSGTITSLAVHPSGDHVLVGAEDKRLAWYDLDMGDKPYKALRYHRAAVRGAAYHRSYPLFASCSDDGTAQVFHGMVYSDLMTNPLLVPLKVLRGHSVVDSAGVLDCTWHPTQPWLITAGADGTLCMFCN